jgi:thioredoxin-related protein
MNRCRPVLFLLVPLLVAAGASAAEVEWRELDAALTEAEAVGKPVMIHFTAEWCGWCKKMKSEVYQRPELAAALHEDFVTAMVDTDRRPDLKVRYGVQGLPTIWFLTSAGEGITYIPGYVDAATFQTVLRWIATGAYREQSFEDFRGGDG